MTRQPKRISDLRSLHQSPAYVVISPKSRVIRVLILLVGLVIPQAILFGPSMLGLKVLLPLDLLAMETVYLPSESPFADIVPENFVLSDQIFTLEFSRRFVAREYRAGHLPLWSPNSYSGAPFTGFAKYSPFNAIYFLFPSPYTLVWIQLVKALVAGTGAYIFFRYSLKVHFWPAAFGAWCYPLTGHFMIMQGYPAPFNVAWLPWILQATDLAARQPNWQRVAGLVLTTVLVLVSGQVDVAGQVLILSGLYALWCLFDQHIWRAQSVVETETTQMTACHVDRREIQEKSSPEELTQQTELSSFSRPHLRRLGVSTCVVTLAWILGFMIAAPYLLPLVEYTRTGTRLMDRSTGTEERPPVGLKALPLVIFPYNDGNTCQGSFYIGAIGNKVESASCTYAGLVATLFALPLALCSRRHASVNMLWVLLVILGLAWSLNVPGLVFILRLPLLNMMSHNRFVFASSFAILALAVIGLHVLWRGGISRRWWYIFPAAVAVVLFGWCLYRMGNLPEPIATQLEQAASQGQQIRGLPDLDAVPAIQQTFSRNYGCSALLCLATLSTWLVLMFTRTYSIWLPVLVSVVMVFDLLWFARNENPQCNPALYYPTVPALKKIAEGPPGRILGYRCLQPRLYESHGLSDIRGYDGIDPRRYLELLTAVADEKMSVSPSYARTQNYVPKMVFSSDWRLICPPIMNMLNLRYVVLRGEPSNQLRIWFQNQDYYVLENESALPRVFVPKTVAISTNDQEMLAKLSSPQFDPRKIAFVEQPVSLPSHCRGQARIVDEVPNRITIEADMKTAGLVVVADSWDAGWHAYLNNNLIPVLRTNYAIRGVRLPEGKHTFELRYQPASLKRGCQLMYLGLVALAASLILTRWWERDPRRERSCQNGVP